MDREGQPRIPLAMPGMTLITKSFILEFVAVVHFLPTHSINLTELLHLPLKSVTTREPARLALEKGLRKKKGNREADDKRLTWVSQFPFSGL